MRFVAAVSIVIVMFLSVPLWAGEPPLAMRDCTHCHVENGQAALKIPTSRLCQQCHKDRQKEGEHVVDMIPSMDVGGLPLSEGRVTCFTCHNPHGTEQEKLLRISPRYLCQQCHKF